MTKKYVYAKSKYVRMSAQKVRLVADMIRGENAVYASEVLEFVNKAAALPVRKTLESAIANAVNNEGMDKKELKIVEARVDDAPIFKRGRAVSKGRYHKILKRNSHIIIAVSGEQQKTAAKKTKAKAVKAVSTEEQKEEIEKQGDTIEKKKKEALEKMKRMDIAKKAQIKTTGTQRKVQAKG
ncbi:50S ribosomal protein L22 [Candidatus Dojkabacteria bacterium]|nr:50S ribosomal protein L22 [Candidatus Dojkabacteria bacterium]